MVSILKSGGILAMTLGWSASALATTYYVDNKLDDYAGHDGSSWEKAFLRIQDAVEKAKNDDVVMVARGTYGDDQGVVWDKGSADGTNENYSYCQNRIWINNKHITLKSSEGAAVTHIVGAHSTDTATGVGTNAVRCISMSGNANIGGTRIEGFTLRDGATLAYKAGMTVTTDGTPVKECSAAHRGGGVLFNYTSGGKASDIHIVDCVISNCVAAEGAAVYGASLIRTRVFDNWTDRADGAIVVQGNAYNCVFARNGRVDYEGTMRRCDKSHLSSAINCTFFDNRGVLKGGSNIHPTLAYNCLIQINGKTESSGASIVSEAACLTNCAVDASLSGNAATVNLSMTTRAHNAVLAAPIFGDFRPVAATGAKNIFGRGDKAYCQMDWIPEADRNLDLAGAARWDAEDNVTAGAYQQGVAKGGGCLTVTFANGTYLVDGKDVHGPNNGYFYSSSFPSQHRFKFVPNEGAEIGHVWLGGYEDSWRYTDMNGEVVVTAPPRSTDSMMCVEAKKVTRTYWADANYAGDDSDGTEAKPYKTLQDAVNVVPPGSSNYYLVKVKPGRYDRGGADFWGQARVYFTGRHVCMRSTDGAEKTFIVGADGEEADADGCGTNAVRCVSVNFDSSAKRQVGVVGFTLTGGRTWNNTIGDSTQNNCRNGAGFFATDQVGAQAVDCVITDCVAVRGSATYKGMFDNCRIFGNRQAESGIEAARGVVWQSYLTGSVVGPNSYTTVCVDQFCQLYNCTVYETQGSQHLSADSDYYNVLDLGSTYLPTMKQAFAGVAIYSTKFDNVNPGQDFLRLTALPVANHLQGDFRPVIGSPIIGAGIGLSNETFVVLTGGGLHKDLLIRDGVVTIGADGDVATPVTLTSAKGVEVSGGLDTGYVSANFPLTLTATLTDRDFYGFKVNGGQASAARTLMLTPTTDVTAYSVEPLYEKLGAVMLLR